MDYRKTILCGIIVTCGFAVACGVDVPPVNERDVPFTVKHEAGAIVSAYFIVVDDAGVPTWQKLDDKHFTRGDTETVVAAPPGEYAFTTGDFALAKVIDKTAPRPKPAPVPPDEDEEQEDDDNKPEPLPESEVVWLYLYDNPKDRSEFPEFGALLASRYFKELDDSTGFEVQLWSKQDATARRYFGYVEGLDLPAAAIVTQKGKLLGKATVESQSQLKQLIKESTGRE